MSWMLNPADYFMKGNPMAPPLETYKMPPGAYGQTGPEGGRALINKITASDGRQYQVIVGMTTPDHRDGPAYVFKNEEALARAYIEALVSLQAIQDTINGG